MGRREEYLALVASAEANPVVYEEAEQIAATEGDGDAPRLRLPPIVRAIVQREDLPAMPDQIIEGVLYETHKLLLTGPSKAHKTWTLIALGTCVAMGGWWLGMRCAKRRVLYVDFETDERGLQRRVSEVAYAMRYDPSEVSVQMDLWPLRGQMCGLDEITYELSARCERGHYGLVILDPSYMIQEGDENNAHDIKEFFAKLDHLCVTMGCTIVISHHHSKGAQGFKSSIDRSSGSGVFGRAPDAVLDLTELVIEPGTMELARASNKLAATRSLTGWRISFTLREFPPKDNMDAWFVFPLLVPDDTELLADCKPNFGGQSEARRMRAEAEGAGKVAQLDSVCEHLIGANGFCWREDVEHTLGWSTSTVNRWLEKSRRFVRVSPAGGTKAKIVRAEEVGNDE